MQDDQASNGEKGIIRGVLSVLWECKWWWIVPMLLMALMFGILLLSSDVTGDAPFIYTLF